MIITKNKNTVKSFTICGLAAMFVTVQFLLQVTPGIMVSPMMRTFDINIIQISILSSSYFYTYLLLQTPSGMLVDKYGPRKILIWSLLLCAISCMVFITINDYHQAVGLRMLMGIFSAPAISIAFALCASWFPARLFALSVGLVEASVTLCAAFAQYGLGLVVHSSSGWQGAIFILSAFGFILLIFVVFFVKDGGNADDTEFKSDLLTNLLKVIKKSQVWIAGVYSGLMFIVVAGFASLWCVPYIQVLYNVDVVDASIASSAIFLGTAIGAPLSGWLSDLNRKRKPTMYIFSICALIVSVFVVYYPPEKIYYMYVLLVMFGLFGGGYMVPFAIIREITSHSVRGTAMGFTNMMCILFGAPIFQPLIGLLLDYSARGNLPVQGEVNFLIKDYQSAFILLPISFIISICILFFVRETNCRPVE